MLGRPALLATVAVAAALAACRSAPAPSGSTAPGVAASSRGAGIAFDAQDVPLDAAMATALRTGKPVAIFFLAAWCPHCRDLDRETIPDAAVAAEMSRFYTIRYDATKGAGKAAANALNVHAFPTVVLLDSRGTRVKDLAGFSRPRDFIARVRMAKPA